VTKPVSDTAPAVGSDPETTEPVPDPVPDLEPASPGTLRAITYSRWMAVALSCLFTTQLLAAIGAAGAGDSSPIRGAVPWLMFAAVFTAVLAVAAIIVSNCVKDDPAVRLALAEAEARHHAKVGASIDRQIEESRRAMDARLRGLGLVPAGERRRPSPHPRGGDEAGSQ
jgi:type VI protein secretion system component VasK